MTNDKEEDVKERFWDRRFGPVRAIAQAILILSALAAGIFLIAALWFFAACAPNPNCLQFG